MKDVSCLRIEHFSSDEDVKDYIDKSLKSVGWKDKDIRLNIQKLDTLITGIYRLTNEAGLLMYLEKMFDRVQNGIGRKLELNDKILIEIAGHIESSSPDSNDHSSDTTLTSRAAYIAALKEII